MGAPSSFQPICFLNTHQYIPCLLVFNWKWVMSQYEKVWIPTSVDKPLYVAIASFVSFFQPPLLATIFSQYCPNEIRDKYQNNPWQKVFSSWLEDYKKIYTFLYTTLLYTSRGWKLIWSNNNPRYQKELRKNKIIGNERLAE